jgi:two-component system, OmpR family, phosphate regulon response regulator PhoB
VPTLHDFRFNYYPLSPIPYPLYYCDYGDRLLLINVAKKVLSPDFLSLLLVSLHQLPVMMLALNMSNPSASQTPGTVTNRILVVEDEESIRESIVLGLEEEGFEVVAVADGQKALTQCQAQLPKQQEFPFDLIILDLMLPQVNGLDLCRFLRYQGNHVPILIVSAKTTETDRVLGLEVGADDYISKPFSMRELVARCRALLRRHRLNFAPDTPVLEFQEIALYPEECRVLVRGNPVNLSPKEFRLLELFMQHPRRVWAREQLLDRVWGVDFIGDHKTVDVHIRWLREKLEVNPSQPLYVITVRGFGYRFG